MLNSVKARPKQSHVAHLTNIYVFYIFVILVLLCFAVALTYTLWEGSNGKLASTYITPNDRKWYYNFFTRYGNWILIFGNVIPISLIITLEMTKFIQGYLMEMDKGMLSYNDIPCKVQNSNLNEELGQIQYIFSDKTGTLTQNDMVFKHLMVGDQVYGESTGYFGNAPPISHVDFSDPKLWETLKGGNSENQKTELINALSLLGLCHTIVIEEPGVFNAESPDEMAFVSFAKLTGFEFLGMNDENLMMVNELGTVKTYQLLDVFEFNSDRKRMSVIIKDESGKIKLMSKGADNIMEERLDQTSMQKLPPLKANLDKFAEQGFRTLLLGSKNLSSSEYEAFKSEYEVKLSNPGCKERSQQPRRKDGSS